jgi:hypothetical protein
MPEHEKRHDKSENKDHQDQLPTGEGQGDEGTGTPLPEPAVRWPNNP